MVLYDVELDLLTLVVLEGRLSLLCLRGIF